MPRDEDNILLAEEIAGITLPGTELLVLSACQTALGDIDGNGVHGLQRAFKLSGVDSIIMSLWEVNDDATMIMMTNLNEFGTAYWLARNNVGIHDPVYIDLLMQVSDIYLTNPETSNLAMNYLTESLVVGISLLHDNPDIAFYLVKASTNLTSLGTAALGSEEYIKSLWIM